MMMQPQWKGKHQCTTCSTPLQIFTFTLLLLHYTTSAQLENPSSAAATATNPQSRRTSEILATSTPSFGTCLSTSTPASTVQCAFRPSQCPPNSAYSPPSYTTSTRCQSPHNVKIGRCKAWSDKNSCNPTRSLCNDPSNWVEEDDSCTLVEDRSTNYDRLTQYPQCRRKGSLAAEPLRCVFSHDECLSATEQPVAMRSSNKICLCYDVPTGMCYSTSPAAEERSIDTSFCAIGPDDCPIGYSFMTAYELDRLQMTPGGGGAPRRCRLCQKEDIGNYALHETIVESGGCYSNGGDYVRCALESTDCDSSAGETFRSSAALRAEGVARCPADIFVGGVCSSAIDRDICTNRASSCRVQAKFDVVSMCTLHSDLVTDEPSYYGECRQIWSTGGDWTQRRCVWEKSECRDGTEEYNSASQPEGYVEGCKCEDVQTGACRADDGSYYCAVSKYGCDDPEDYIPSGGTKAMDGLDCRLCHPKRMLEVPTLYPTTKVHGELMEKYTEENQFTKDSGGGGGGGGVDDTFTEALIYAGSFGGCFVLTSIAIFVYYRKGSSDDGSSSSPYQPRIGEAGVV